MIVKNEQRWLAECLASVRDYVDEIVIVDTGSTDATIHIAQNMGARVFELPWPGSFSDARNASIQHAKGDWILILDADEKLADRDARQLRSLVNRAEVDGFLLSQRSYLWDALTVSSAPNPRDYEEGQQFTHCIEVAVIRLFRNRRYIRYEGLVHELVEPVFLRDGLRFKKIPVIIHHFGKVGDPAALERKRALYLELGERKCEQQPLSGQAQYELAMQLYELKRYEESIPHFEKAHTLDKTFNISLLFIAKAYHTIGDWARAQEYYLRCTKIDSRDPRILFELGNFSRDQGHLQQSESYFNGVLEQDPDHVLANFNLGGVYLKLGNSDKAFTCFQKAAALNPFNELIFDQLGRLALTDFQTGEIVQLLEDFLKRCPHSRRCAELLAQLHFKLRKFEATIAWATTAILLAPDNVLLRALRAHSKFALGDTTGAEEDYLAVLSIDSSHLDSLMNLVTLAELRGDEALLDARCEQVLEFHPHQFAILKKYGLRLSKRSDDRAISVLEEAHRTSPDDTECLLTLGFLYERSRQVSKALELYRNAAARNPKLTKLAEQKLRNLENSRLILETKAKPVGLPTTELEAPPIANR